MISQEHFIECLNQVFECLLDSLTAMEPSYDSLHVWLLAAWQQLTDLARVPDLHRTTWMTLQWKQCKPLQRTAIGKDDRSSSHILRLQLVQG